MVNAQTPGDAASSRRVLHVITPGDHYSPMTGSATVSVVHGLSAARPPGVPTPRVAIERGTYPVRYDSADIVEYDRFPWRPRDRYVDAALARVGLPRLRARARYGHALAGQSEWEPQTIVGHNGVQLIPEVDHRRHRGVLYAHNDLLRTYTRREAGRALSHAAAIVAVSDYLADRLADGLPASLRDRVVAIRNGVDLDLFRPDAKAEPRDVLSVVYVGRVIPDKGIDVLIDAVMRLSRDDIRLSVVGSAGFDAGLPLTPYEESLRTLAAPADDRIRFEPFRPRNELARLLAGSDVVVVPSRWPEPFALTVLEGMASGAAVVASDIGGIPEAAGGAAILVPPGDAQALAAALEALAQDRGLLERQRAASLVHARTQSWARASAQFYDVIDHLRR